MIGDRQRDRGARELALHDNITAALPNLDESVRFEDAADFASAESRSLGKLDLYAGDEHLAVGARASLLG